MANYFRRNKLPKINIIKNTKWMTNRFARRLSRRRLDEKVNIIVHYNGNSKRIARGLNAEKRVLNFYHNYHLGKGWKGFAYHFAITPSGYIFEGRGFNYIGGADGNSLSNKNNISVLLDLGEGQNIPPKMWQSLLEFKTYVEKLYKNKNLKFIPHSEITKSKYKTACPGNIIRKAIDVYHREKIGSIPFQTELDDSNEIKELQHFLNNYFKFKIKIDGVLDKETRMAMIDSVAKITGKARNPNLSFDEAQDVISLVQYGIKLAKKI